MEGAGLIHEILRAALDADENNDTEKAVTLYSRAVELILKVRDPVLKQKLNRYAVQAIERAEELKGITGRGQTSKTEEGHSSQSKFSSLI